PHPPTSLCPYTTLFRSNGPRRGRDLQSFLGPYPGARRLRCSESHAVVDEGHRFRVNLAWNEDGIGRRGGPASLAVERIGLREERDRKSTRLNSSHQIIS